MAQKVSAREIAVFREMAGQRNGTAGLVQCDGCPEKNLVRPARPGHLDGCAACPSHCQCFRIPDGIDFGDNDSSEVWSS